MLSIQGDRVKDVMNPYAFKMKEKTEVSKVIFLTKHAS